MATDPKPSVSPNGAPAPRALPPEVEQALASGLGNYTLRELLGCMLSSVGVAEREAYLERTGEDKANGFYDRAVQVGSLPVDHRVPRTRTGDFRPASLTWNTATNLKLTCSAATPFCAGRTMK